MTQLLIVITGPTASGKTGLALDLARQFNGEIICADSRTIYKDMDIGTAKPTQAEQSLVPHHLLDIVEPGERYTAQDFQNDAVRAIEAIRSRGKVPFLVGGTGLYIDAVTLEYAWPAQAETNNLDELDIATLQAMIKKQHLELPENSSNKRHLINTLKRGGVVGSSRLRPQENTHVVAIATEKGVLRKRIQTRAREMFQHGVIEETARLAEAYGWDSEAMKSNIYPIIKNVIDGKVTEAEAVEEFVIKDWRLAKRQITWLKRHNYVTWLNLEDARAHIETILG